MEEFIVTVKCKSEEQAVAITNALEDIDNLNEIVTLSPLMVSFNKTDANYEDRHNFIVNIE